MRIVNASYSHDLRIGRVGENNAVRVIFPYVEKYRTWYGEGVFSLLNKRPGEEFAYPVTINFDDENAWWDISDVDSAIAGKGKAQLIYTVNDTIAKTQIYNTLVTESIDNSGEIPEPVQPWVDMLIEKMAEIDEIKEVIPDSASQINLLVTEAQLDAQSIDDTQASSSHPWSGLKTETEIDSAVDPVQEQVNVNERKLNALWKISEGQTYDLEAVSESGMNEAPSGSQFMTPREVRGKSEQGSTNGYQMIPQLVLDAQFHGGVINAIVKNDGVHLSWSGPVSRYSRITITSDLNLPAGTYYFSERPDTYNGFAVEFNYTEDNVTHYIYERSITFSQPVTLTCIIVARVALDSAGTDIIKPMINIGETKKDWELYTAGIPSPNPDYPQEIHGVEEIRLRSVGKNLCDWRSFPNTSSYGLTIVNNGDGTITVSGTQTVTFVTRVDYYPGDWQYEIINRNRGKIIRTSDNGQVETDPCLAVGIEIQYTGQKDYVLTKNSYATTIRSDVPIEKVSYRFGYTAVNIPINRTLKLMTEFLPSTSSAVTAYEPYHGTSRTITPPFKLNGITAGGYSFKDTLDVDAGVWRKRLNELLTSSSASDLAIGRMVSSSSNTAILIYTQDVWDTDEYVQRYYPAFCEIGSYSSTGIARMTTVSDSGWSGKSRLQINNELGLTSDQIRADERYIGKRCVYPAPEETIQPIDPDDLYFLRNLALMPVTDHIIVTDQDGNDVPWLNEYIISLREV